MTRYSLLRFLFVSPAAAAAAAAPEGEEGVCVLETGLESIGVFCFKASLICCAFLGVFAADFCCCCWGEEGIG